MDRSHTVDFHLSIVVQVISYRARLLRIQVDLDREGYAYGDTGQATVTVEQAEGETQ